MNNKTALAIMLILFGFIGVKGQPSPKEYLVTVNPATGGYTYISEIPGVSWVVIGPPTTTLDKVNGRYFFVGSAGLSNEQLFTIDVHTGDIIYNPYFPDTNDVSQQPYQLVFDDSAMTLYGLCWNRTTQIETFISVNEVTGGITTICTLPGVVSIADGSYAYDQKHHIYFCIASTSNQVFLYSIQAGTGQILNQVSISGNPPQQLKYDNTTNTLYGSNVGKVVSIDPVTAATTMIANVTAVTAGVGTPNYSSLDEIHHRYMFAGYDSSNVFRLYTVDLATGSVVYNPPFIIDRQADNIIELNYDNNDSTIYALRYAVVGKATGMNAVSANQIVKYYPNPMTSSVAFYFPQAYHQSVINIYSLTGQKVLSAEGADEKQLVVDRKNLGDGAYFFEVIADRLKIAEGKLIIQ